MDGHLIHFDECEAAVKSTVLATDLPLHHWQGLHCTHEKHERAPGMNSSDLSRYPPEMMQGLSTAIIQHIAMEGSEPPLEVRAHSLQPTGEVPVPEVVDRPSTNTGVQVGPNSDGAPWLQSSPTTRWRRKTESG